MSDYSEKLKDPRWIEAASRIRDRDQNMCVQCGSGGEVHVHHSHYRQGREPWEYRESDLFTLCRKCHEKNHGIELPGPDTPTASTPLLTDINKLRMVIEGYIHLIGLPDIEEPIKPLIFDGIVKAKKALEVLEGKRRESYA